MTDCLFEQCRVWHKEKTQQEGWILTQCDVSGCEFLKDSFPLGTDIVRLKRVNDGTFAYSHTKRYYRGSWPRVLERKEWAVTDRGGFATLSDLLAYLETT